VKSLDGQILERNLLKLIATMLELNSIQQFYAGKTVFITGGSGFMGKVLIEKLLYACSDVKELIILMRAKRGKSAAQRVDDFAKIPLFERIMKEKPQVMNKITPVWGDISSANLGLNEEHLNKVLSCSQIVFHMAASLKLEATLKPNILANLTATKNVLDLAKQMKNLIQFVHTSTAFCYEDQEVLLEKVYDFPHRPEDLMKCAEWMTESAMSAMQKEILGSQPNTYTYTKRLAEVLVRDHYQSMPVCIVRPSIVSPSFREPMPGCVSIFTQIQIIKTTSSYRLG
jgi:alcohol-forming fatty acyl-CoA reductase